MTLVALLASLSTPLLQDLQRISCGNYCAVRDGRVRSPHEDRVLISVKAVDPDLGRIVISLIYITELTGRSKVDLWLYSGSAAFDGVPGNGDNPELLCAPVTMGSPTTFHWALTTRTVFKQDNIIVGIDKGDRSHSVLFPFERYNVMLRLVLAGSDCGRVQPAIWFALNDTRFVHTPPIPLEGQGGSCIVILERPMHQKIGLVLSLSVALGAVTWSLAKIFYTTVDATESLELLAFETTVLLAVPGLRGVLIASSGLTFVPLFDFPFVVIWTFGLLSLFVMVIRHDVIDKWDGSCREIGGV